MEKRLKETWLSRKPPTQGFVIGAVSCVLVIFGSLCSQNNWFQLTEWMSASKLHVIVNHQYWRLWTSLFVHADAKHLLGNLFLFFILGSFVTAYFGSFLFPILAILFGGFTNYVVLRGMPEEVNLIGISGVVFWLGGLWLMLYFFLDRIRSLYSRALRALGVSLALFMPAEAFSPEVSYRSHLYGFVFGGLVGLFYFYAKKKEFRAAEVVDLIHDDFITPTDSNTIH